LNPGPHGPELWALSSTEIDLEGLEFISRPGQAISSRFEDYSRAGLLHELLHKARTALGSWRSATSSPTESEGSQYRRQPAWQTASWAVQAELAHLPCQPCSGALEVRERSATLSWWRS